MANGGVLNEFCCPSAASIIVVLMRQAVDELEQQIADLTARLAATTAEKLQYKAERDALAEVVGRQNAELQLYREQRHSQPHSNPVGPESTLRRPQIRRLAASRA